MMNPRVPAPLRAAEGWEGGRGPESGVPPSLHGPPWPNKPPSSVILSHVPTPKPHLVKRLNQRGLPILPGTWGGMISRAGPGSRSYDPLPKNH